LQKEAVGRYKTEIKSLTDENLPVSLEELKSMDEEAKQKAFLQFNKGGLTNIDPDKLQHARDTMLNSKTFYQ
jgi:hypothetical protein